ncbi:MAG: D-alanine--D-alanine ligase [Rhodobacteraceae bacterium]|nr:D-alanine--D-alanine ligase [Paracoccaceae bacterium]
MSSRTTQRVVVLMGGISLEREVSLSSGRCCASALREIDKFEVLELVADNAVAKELDEISPDVVFNALHGRWGEDGAVQGILEWLKIPYTHSGIFTSAMCMDKLKTKSAYEIAGLPVTKSVLALREKVSEKHIMDPPYVVKPINEGSSVGVHIIPLGSNVPPSLDRAMPEYVMVEEFVDGRDLTVTVIGSRENPRALAVTEVVTDGWYDYHAKYSIGGSTHVLPADIPNEIKTVCLNHAKKAHNFLGCRGISRTDFRWDDSKGKSGLFLLETNTQPGMTPTSLAPEQALFCGITLSELCSSLIEDASCNR